jgi:hypothetical protein
LVSVRLTVVEVGYGAIAMDHPRLVERCQLGRDAVLH